MWYLIRVLFPPTNLIFFLQCVKIVIVLATVILHLEKSGGFLGANEAQIFQLFDNYYRISLVGPP